MMEKVFERLPKDKLYQLSGVQFAQLNTIYQLFAMNLQNPEVLKKADKLLFIADLVNYFLCGAVFNECTIASTSQLLNVKILQWSAEIFQRLDLPIDLMSKIVTPGTMAGILKAEIASQLGCKPVPVIAVGSHDTASAVAAVPARKTDWAFISSGTWSIMGIEIPTPIINPKTFNYGFANEVGVGNNIRLLKNLAGMWPVQECRREWEQEGEKLTYSQIAKMAQAAQPFAAAIDLDDKEFFTPGNMSDKISRYLLKTGQKELSGRGQIVRVILESLAGKYCEVFRELEDVVEKEISTVHIIGGGSQNELLCQFTANSLGRKVTGGPVEAASIGNIMVQALTAGQIRSLSKGRDLIRHSFDLKSYSPENKDAWEKQFNAFTRL
jgi:rhamnulokinase